MLVDGRPRPNHPQWVKVFERPDLLIYEQIHDTTWTWVFIRL